MVNIIARNLKRASQGMPHLLELFCGTKSIGKAFERNGFSCCSVDIVARFEPTLCISVHDLTREMILEHGDPDVIWMSPPCQQYSCCRTSAKTPRDLEGADALVRRALEIASWFPRIPWFMENPHSGLLKTREVVRSLQMNVVDYCQYAVGTDFLGRSRKRTAIWTNADWKPARPLCDKRTCHFCTDGKSHDHCAQRIDKTITGGRGFPRQSLYQLYSIPEPLPQELCDFMRSSPRWGIFD